MAKNVKIIDRDIKKYKKILDKTSGSYVKVGFPSSGELKDGKKSKGAKIFLDLVQIAAVHEFGTKNIPERSFVRPAYDKNKGTINKLIVDLHKKVLMGDISIEKALDILGLKNTQMMREAIDKLPGPPLSEKTVARKKSDALLIDTGQLRKSIQYAKHVGKGGKNV